MKMRPLGSTGMHVSRLGLGTVKFGRNIGVKYPRGFDLPDDTRITELLELARELGINLIDTAPAYGSSEERLGKLLGNRREEWLICTKVGEEFDPATGLSRFDFSPRHARTSIERSLARLRTDVLDIVLVHSDGNDLGILRDTGILPELDRLKAQGKLRAYGLSTKTVEGGLAALEAADCVMLAYNRGDASQRPVLDRAAKLGKGVLVKKPLASGHLAEGSADDALRSNFRFIFSHPAVDTAIVGTIDPAHLRADCAAVD